MTFPINIGNALIRVATEFKAIRILISGSGTGDVAALETAATNLTSAVNEVLEIAQNAAGSGGATSLDGLTDVTLTSPTTGEVIRYNGTQWVNVDGTAHFQPRSADLDALVALDIESYGSGLLELANHAALIQLIGDAMEGVKGVVPLASLAQAQAGTDTTTAVTPAGVAAVITQLIGAAPEDLNEWAELVSSIQASESDIAGIMATLGNKQDKDATLTALAGVATAANKLIYATGPDSFVTTDLTSFGRQLIAIVDAPAARNLLSVYSQAEIGDPETDFVAIFQSALA